MDSTAFGSLLYCESPNILKMKREHGLSVTGEPSMSRKIMKLCAALISLVFLASAQTQFVDIPFDGPLTSFSSPEIKEVKISGKTVATISNGDFVHPAFSPDGKILAYSKVLTSSDFENTEVLLYNTGTRKTSVLLGRNRAKKYATYKGFVSEMNWRSPRRLEVEVGDGDVNSTQLTFDPLSRQLLQERYRDEFEEQPLSPMYKRARQRVVSLFPEFPPAVLDVALANSSLVVPNVGVVLQKNYAGHDHNVWLLDFQSKSIKSLIELTENYTGAFGGGLSFKSSIILLISNKSNAYLFLYRDGKIKGLTKFDSNSWGQVEVKHRSSDRVVFLVKNAKPMRSATILSLFLMVSNCSE